MARAAGGGCHGARLSASETGSDSGSRPCCSKCPPRRVVLETGAGPCPSWGPGQAGAVAGSRAGGSPEGARPRAHGEGAGGTAPRLGHLVQGLAGRPTAPSTAPCWPDPPAPLGNRGLEVPGHGLQWPGIAGAGPRAARHARSSRPRRVLMRGARGDCFLAQRCMRLHLGAAQPPACPAPGPRVLVSSAGGCVCRSAGHTCGHSQGFWGSAYVCV